MINNNCRGCVNLSGNGVECFYTKVGIPAFSNCPCQICLIKLLCHTLCDDFFRMIDKEKNITHYGLSESLDESFDVSLKLTVKN